MFGKKSVVRGQEYKAFAMSKRERRGYHREATWFAGPRSHARGGRKVISPRGICVNPAWYDDGGSAAQQPQHPASHLLSSARPTYTGVSAKRCKKDDDDDGNDRTFGVGVRPSKNLVKIIKKKNELQRCCTLYIWNVSTKMTVASNSWIESARFYDCMKFGELFKTILHKIELFYYKILRKHNSYLSNHWKKKKKYIR